MADSLTSGTPTVRSAHLEATGQASSNSERFVTAHVISLTDHIAVHPCSQQKGWNRLQIGFVYDAARAQMISKIVTRTKIELAVQWRSQVPTHLGRSVVPS